MTICVNGTCSHIFACAFTGRCNYAPPPTLDPPFLDQPETDDTPRPSEIRPAAIHDYAEINRIMNRRPKSE